jgi:beta-N-acetylhexosaminidase
MPSTSTLDLRQQAGQVLVMGFDGQECSARLRSTFSSLQPGGVILFARNIALARQTWQLLQDIRKCLAQPAFLCVDMEGGMVDRLKDIIAPAPTAADVAASGNRKLFREHGQVLGLECRALGFNVDFAPVVDLGFAASRSVLASRTVSDDPRKVIAYAREVLRGLRAVGVLGCGKHFPGLGEANLDTHKELPSIAKPAARLWKEDLAPYVALHRQMPFIMTAHAGYPAVTRDNAPVTLSKKWMADILRQKIGYHGLILADDLEMGGVLAAAPIEEAAVATLRAGADCFLVCHNEEKVWGTYEAVLSAAERDRRFARIIADRARRILALKKKAKLGAMRVPAPTGKTLDKLRRRIWELDEEVRLAQAASA